MPCALYIERIAVAVMRTGGFASRREAGRPLGRRLPEWWIFDPKEGGGKTIVMGMCFGTYRCAARADCVEGAEERKQMLGAGKSTRKQCDLGGAM